MYNGGYASLWVLRGLPGLYPGFREVYLGYTRVSERFKPVLTLVSERFKPVLYPGWLEWERFKPVLYPERLEEERFKPVLYPGWLERRRFKPVYTLGG